MAITSYPAIFFKEKSGGYSAIFPDLNHLGDCGETLEETIKNAMSILAFYLYEAKRDGDKIPAPTDIKKVNPASEMDENDDYAPEDIFVNLISVDVEECAKKYFEKSIRKNVTIPQWLNDEAIARDINFSETLQEALKEKIKA